MKITKYAFRKLFTFEERVAIETAAQSSASLRVLVDDMNAAEVIDLSDTSLETGLAIFVSNGLLTDARVNEILNVEESAIPLESRVQESNVGFYTVKIKALADISETNIGGAIQVPSGEYQVAAEFTDGETSYSETLSFGYTPPSPAEINAAIERVLLRLKVDN